MMSGVGRRESGDYCKGDPWVALTGRPDTPSPATRLPTLAILTVLLVVLSLATHALAQPLTPVRPAAASSDSLRVPAAADTASRGRDTLQVVMHHHNHKQQIIAGSVIMACFAGIMVVMNNYNPRSVTGF